MEDHNEREAHMPSALMEYFADLNKLTYNDYIVEHARHGTTDVCRAHELSFAETCQEPGCILKSRAYRGFPEQCPSGSDAAPVSIQARSPNISRLRLCFRQ
jgi:hypothetical protein